MGNKAFVAKQVVRWNILIYLFVVSLMTLSSSEYTKCPINLRPLENSVIWQNVEKCKEGKVVTYHVFLISSVRIFDLGRAITVLHFLTRP
jgi:hypothetical protein